MTTPRGTGTGKRTAVINLSIAVALLVLLLWAAFHPDLRRHMPTLIAPLVIIALAIPLIAGRIERNGFYGFRTARTLSSDAVWYPANRTGGALLLAAGAIWLVTGLFVPASAVPVGLAALAVALVIWFLYMTRFRDRV